VGVVLVAPAEVTEGIEMLPDGVTPCDVYELRVHGVSGTSAAAMLDVPQVKQVAGDDKTGFYRRRDADGRAHGPVQGRQLEAYRWGGLTSGRPWRALWLLLTPFMLINVAPSTAAVPLGFDQEGEKTVDRRWRRVLEAALRLTGLSLTVLLVVAVAVVCLDLTGWQLAAGGGDLPSWLGFLTGPQPRQFVLAALGPLALVALVGFLGSRTWRLSERERPPAAPGGHVDTPIEDRAMWNGETQVRRHRAMHLATALATVATTVLLPLWFSAAGGLVPIGTVWRRAGGPAVVIISGLVMLLMAASTVLLCLPALARRERPEDSTEPESGRDGYTALPWVGLGLVAAAVVVIWPGAAWRSAWPTQPGGPLPGMSALAQALFLAQAVLLIVVAVAAAVLRRSARRRQAGQAVGHAGSGAAVGSTPAWLGLGPAVFAMLAVLLAAGWAAGSAFAFAWLLGRPEVGFAAASVSDDLIMPPAYAWAAVVTLVALAALAIAGAVVWAAVRAQRQRCTNDVLEDYSLGQLDGLESDRRGRVKQIARSRAAAGLDRVGRGALGLWFVVVGVTVLVALAGQLIDPTWAFDELAGVAALGVAVLVLATVVLIFQGQRIFHDRELRQKAGILWDLGTFWPRAAHPLAPPCYMERVIPDLLKRMKSDAMSSAGQIVLSCHSQGAVIGAAVVMQMDTKLGKRVSLLTYGSPVRRLYSSMFPAYFSNVALVRTGQFLRDGGWTPALPRSGDLDARRTWRWRNLYRPTDPIGGPIFVDYRGQSQRTDDVDRWLLDPVFDKPPGDTNWPATKAHGGYPADPAYAEALDDLTKRRPHPDRHAGDRVPTSAGAATEASPAGLPDVAPEPSRGGRV
jgi:hypothetical protein